MRKTFFSKISFMLIAILLMWLKTYAVYKTSFHIKIDNLTQEFILFINPLSFLLLIFGLSLFLKGKNRNRYIIAMSCLVTFVLLANMVFYRFYNDFLTIPVLFQTSNMGDLGSSIGTLLEPTDLLLAVDIAVLIWLHIRQKAFQSDIPSTKNERAAYFLFVSSVYFFNLGLSEAERPQLLTRSFDREMLVKNISLFNFHIYDGVLQSKQSAQRALADSNSLTEIENYVTANAKDANKRLFGAAKGRNVILVSLESTQSFVINEKLNGEEITPFLNDFIKQSYNFNNVYHQTGQGKTSDSEFIVDNSLYPLGRGAVFFTNAGNQYMAAPEILKNSGYYSAVLHANNKSFWNRDLMYDSFGYDSFFDINSYDVTDENSVGWGLKDKEFFEQSSELMKNLPQPFYSRLITLTNHFPFDLDEEDQLIDEYDSSSQTLNKYFPTVRYQDEALKRFIEKLKEDWLYDNSVIVLYGDHYGISENHNEAMGEFLGKEITPFEEVQLQKVPLVIHIPGITDKKPQTIETVGGQIDIRPTLMNLLGIDTKDQIQFGNDLLSDEKLDFTVLRDGSFITDQVVYTDGACYDKETGKPLEETKQCEAFADKAKQELSLSDEIIYGDLLRFYDQKRLDNSSKRKEKQMLDQAS
ncbi:LTA synthase family protein [Bacillus subtilis subsp. subtilis]|uniref:LTA synthase family protein n=1 Tax=Bacillus subtilis TaxID=1423 RepID=UPI000CD1611F|nr:LTA synthase family protein [Bacillus subtilis]AYK57636.1 LTA synthase family protein [Bacillus subtilis subsp. subtilis]POD84158.1 Phosphatidylglycerol--membrane-oligosaccharide glycerophosphotransferase [Bacillus subtilis subsp. subtilis]CAF1738252.1 Lipoteichoic acid synthase 1 [Bacillus subtilis]CAI6288462.1 Lipoteichoic acid synthase-like YqgS [Bacillus subtilis]